MYHKITLQKYTAIYPLNQFPEIRHFLDDLSINLSTI